MTRKPPTTDQLHEAIMTMDALADEGFSQIAAIAQLAISHLCSSDLPVHDTIARAFEAIKRIAESQSESICAEAGAVAPHPVGTQANMGA